MVRWVIAIVVVGTFLGAVMPSRKAPAAEAGVTAKASKADWGSAAEPLPRTNGGSSWSAATAVPDEPLSSEPLTLERERNGHFFANAKVNGTTIRFLVDTGATQIALTVEDARKAGVRMDGETSVIGRGASGPVRGQEVTIDRVRLGSQESTTMEAVVIEGGDQSLLGQSFLAKFSSVEIQGDTMTLR